MTNECRKLLEKLTFTEYKSFIRNALGLLFFNSLEYSNNHAVLSSKSRRKSSKNVNYHKDAVAYLYFEGDSRMVYDYEFVFYVDKNDYERKVFRQNEIEETIDSYFLEGKLSDSDLLFLLLVSFYGPDNTLFKQESNLSLKTSKDISNLDIYSFILGSGIDYDYGIKSWKVLVTDIENKVSTLSGLPVSDLRDYSSKKCNTNYFTPQILKDLDQDDYFLTIRHFLYNSFDMSETIDSVKPTIENRNLYQVCRIVATQHAFVDKQTILTFDYDDIVELTLQNSFVQDSFSSHEFCEKQDKPITIEHVHGFMPFAGENSIQRKSIVLAHDEYLNNYSSSASYSYSKLYSQLRKRNLIIGNSVADYEEQKVFYNHHKMYLNEFSYALLIKNPIEWLNYYSVVSLYKIGIIPIFFDSHTDICNYLKTIWPPISDM